VTDEERDRLVTIIDEAFGPQAPEHDTGSLLTLLERLLHERGAAHREALGGWDRLRSHLDAIRNLLATNGCDCECEHHHEEHDNDCERCLACRIDWELPR